MAEADADVVTALASRVAALTAGTNLFQGPMRAEDRERKIPAEAVFVLLNGGPPPQHYLNNNTSFNKLNGVQVQVRSARNDFSGGQTLALSVWTAMENNPPTTDYWACRWESSAPLYFQQQDDGAHVWSMQLLLRKEVTV